VLRIAVPYEVRLSAGAAKREPTAKLLFSPHFATPRHGHDYDYGYNYDHDPL
jgi:hypothetical protein